MRKIHVVAPDADWWHEWRRECETATKHLIDTVRNGGAVNIDDALYKERKYDFLMSNNGPFYGKCAYCERDLGSQHGDVEHYRPKRAVTDENDRPVSRIENGQEQKHPGYYWLAYEWTNLLPSCQICNVGNTKKSSTGNPGKRNRFPLSGEYAWLPGEEVNESPLLLNPTLDDPNEHLVFEEFGIIGWASERGRITEKILGLNDYEMPAKRADLYRSVKIRIRHFLREHRAGNPNLAEQEAIHGLKNGQGEFTAFALKAIEDALTEEEHRFRDALALLGN